MLWLKFLHILGAMVWLGGGLTLVLAGVRARQSGDPQAIREFARTVPYVGIRLLGPAWIVLLISGVWMVLVSASWKFEQTWVLLGLGLFAVAFLIGAVYLGRVGMQLQRVAGASGTSDGGMLVGRWILGYGLVLVALLVALWDMVFKPGI